IHPIGDAPGIAVFLSYLAKFRSGSEYDLLAKSYLDDALQAASETLVHPRLYGGLAGVGWGAAQLQQVLGTDTEEVSAEIDEALCDDLTQAPWPETYDLIGGLVGLGSYALERWPRLRPVQCLELVIHRLDETAELRPEGVTWWTNPAWMIPETRKEYPCGYYNLGVAHGVPGVVALLGYALAQGVAGGRGRPLPRGPGRRRLGPPPPDPRGRPWCVLPGDA